MGMRSRKIGKTTRKRREYAMQEPKKRTAESAEPKPKKPRTDPSKIKGKLEVPDDRPRRDGPGGN